MGPFVPDLISDQLNLVVALILGVGFGLVLEQAGFSSPRKLAGVFYGYDFAVLRVFFTAAVTAMTGTILLGYLGLLDTEAIYINPTWLMPAIVGGVIMGLGFIIGGYCPGTSVCAASIGKIDAMFFVGGGLIGVLFYGELYPLYKHFNDSTSLGSIRVFDSLGISQGLFALLLIVIAVAAFAITTLIEKRVNKKSAPSFGFTFWKHFAAGVFVVGLGLILLILPDRKTSLIAKVSSPDYTAGHSVKLMDVDELAFRIIDKEPNIQIIDIRRPQEFGKSGLPGAVNVQTRDLFGKEWIPMLSRRHLKKVILGASVAEETVAASLLRELGYENIAILKGGLPEFNATILLPAQGLPIETRWDNDVRTFRENARVQITKMIADQKNSVSKVPKQEKKIQGGC